MVEKSSLIRSLNQNFTIDPKDVFNVYTEETILAFPGHVFNSDREKALRKVVTVQNAQDPT